MTALAVVLVAHNSAAALERTFAGLLPQLRADDELVVIDSASTDGLAATLPARARLIRSAANVGFAGGAVLGADATHAPLLFFLNPDAVPATGCLDAIREAPGEWGAWQALVTLPGAERVNTDGNIAHWAGLGWAGRLDQPVRRNDAPRDVGFASGAALAVRRADWDLVGGFDPDYFMYGEDLDLSLRLRLAGRGVGIVPAAIVEHDYEFTKGDYKWFHLERNRWWTILALYPAPLLLAVMPALLALELVLLVVAARDGWLRAKFRAQLAVVRSLPAVRRRRARTVRRATGAEFAAGFSDALDSPHASLPASAERLQRWYWRAVRGILR